VLNENWTISKASTLMVERSLRCLQNYSLVRPLTGSNIAIHLLVQKIMLIDIGEKASTYFEAALKLIHSRFPWGDDLENLNECLNYLAHGQSCVKYGIEFENNISEMMELLYSLALFFYRYGQYDKAFGHYENLLRNIEKVFGVDHINTAYTISNLGSTYSSQGKYDEAIAHYERSLRIEEKSFGVDHINTADTINNLGNTYYRQGKYDEAIAHYERSLRINEKAFGVDHMHTARTIMNIGLHHKLQGQVPLAKVWLQRGHKILLTNLGAQHPDTLKADLIIRECQLQSRT
jgi:tetratricopeptide (TPR) repeat protein